MTTTQSIEIVTLELPPELGSAEAETLRARFVDAFDAQRSVCVSGASVRRVGTAALQVLAAACVAQRSDGGALTWRQPSKALTEAAATVGLSELLGLNEV
ncbi:MAG TPA: STAS domain-containing protein [Polyangiaceae bacterium]|nr:STAS domain-containing protein [Polyangiaceae bacterium]